MHTKALAAASLHLAGCWIDAKISNQWTSSQFSGRGREKVSPPKQSILLQNYHKVLVGATSYLRDVSRAREKHTRKSNVVADTISCIDAPKRQQTADSRHLDADT